MSSMPPYTPPGGGAPPPYDPKAQWRAYREQQRAAWQSYREQQKAAWRAQREAWKATMGISYVPHSPSIVGPLILIGVGVLAFLLVTGRIDSGKFWDWYGHWWPLLLIGAGVAMLGEWALDLKRKTPVHRGGNYVGLLILLAIIGVFSAITHQHWDEMRGDWGGHDDFFNMFGRPQHDLDQQVLNTQLPPNAVITIENPRGDVSVTAGDTSQMKVEAHEIAYANGDDEAKRIFEAEAAHVQVSGNTVLLKSDGHSSGRVDLRVIVPKMVNMTINASHGDVTAAGLAAGASIAASHGDVHLSTISGPVQVHFAHDKGDFSGHQITGDVMADGRCNDITLSEVKGKIAINGDVYGTAHFENLAGGLHIHTPRTDIQLADLPGDLTLNDEDLHVTEAKGPVHVSTESKNIDLSEIYGETTVQDRDGNVSVAPAGPFGVDVKSTRGNANLEITLPPNASATVDGRTHNGDIVSDFPLTISGEESKTITGRIGGGNARILLSTEVGDVRIKRGSSFPAALAAPAAEDAARAPAPPNAPHLRAPKTPPAEPVTQ